MRSRIYAASGVPTAGEGSLGEHSPHPSASPSHSSYTPPRKNTRTLDALFTRYRKTRTPPRWDEASALAKATFYHREVSKRGGVSFTLNFGPEVEKAARADPASFTEHVRRRLRRFLKAEFGRTVDYWFGVDISDEGRPHLHGGITVSGNEAEALGRALARAGGKWGSVRGVKHQAHVGDRLDDDWASYATKKITRSRQEVFGSMLSVTDSIRRAAKDAFERERKLVLSVTKEENISHY
ncbi:hypothetical protein Snov_2073 [Ancylobacter novellus DSM 506]|uniref:Replication protein n=1 Tax=Ancylobacter novellus (strain ATCC 8093 / DSM 506 / JCM 20403 / CCM 1077 / IAM 12100 / NBRC 12443 / NCIMB 10456) TaxID=639283 RepID=D7A0B0_ANCN5|nr:hypothetical protein Snov_2073 [Ancylobacter novellus DSM 506]